MIFIQGLLTGAFNILVALLLFGVIVLVHEFGHFIVAKLCGVQVNEFAIGMGPKLFSFGKKETKYSLRLLPIGGFCAMEGEDEASENPRAFGAKKVWQRVLIIIAGAVMNLILGFIIILIALTFFMKPDDNGKYSFVSTKIRTLESDTTAYQTGLRPDDEIVKINGRRIFIDNDIVMQMQNDEDGIMDMVVKRRVDGKNRNVKLTDVTFEIQKDENTGKQYIVYPFIVYGTNRTFFSTIERAVKTEISYGVLIWRSLIDMVSGKYGLSEMSGPIGVVDAVGGMVGDVVKSVDIRQSLTQLAMMMTLITVNVSIFNLLPLPALDGGRLIFLIYEGIFRKPIKPKYEGMVHAIGMVILLGFMAIVAVMDIFKLAR